MVDLHCHILPGLDDGPDDLAGSLDLARAARAEGIEVVTATPHIRDDHPFPPALVRERVEGLRRSLAESHIPLELMAGGEVSIAKVRELDDETLRTVCLGDGNYLLVESPYTLVSELLENNLFDLQLRGFRPLLAHPERSPCFQGDVDRLSGLVERGVLSSVTAGSMEGRFGRTVRGFTQQLFAAGLVHDVATDAHTGTGGRAPRMVSGFESLEEELPGILGQLEWFTVTAPRAIIAGEPLPPPPDPPSSRRRGWRRWAGR